jgi:hypothetical protein
VRVVDGVHCQGFGVVVDRDIDRPAERGFEAGAGAAAAGEVVDYQLVAKVQLQGKGVALHAFLGPELVAGLQERAPRC